jgi:hypothetical protein
VQSLRSAAGQVLRVSLEESPEVSYVIAGGDHHYGRITCAAPASLQAREGLWSVTPVGRRGWDLVATTANGAGAAWFQRRRLRSGGTLLLPDSREYELRRLLLGGFRRSAWALKSGDEWLTRLSVQVGRHPWDITIDLGFSEAASRHDQFPLLLLLGCYAVIRASATTAQGVPAVGGPFGA